MTDKMGIVGEKKVKKVLDQDGFIIHDENTDTILDELGDVKKTQKRRRRKKNPSDLEKSTSSVEEVKAPTDASKATESTDEEKLSKEASKEKKASDSVQPAEEAALEAELDTLEVEEVPDEETKTKKKRRGRRKKGKANEEATGQEDTSITDVDADWNSYNSNSDEPLYADDEFSEEEKLIRKKKRRKILLICVGSFLGVVLAVYLGMAYYFTKHFYFNTTFNQEIDMSLKQAEEVEGYFADQVKVYELTIEQKGDKEEIVKGSAINVSIKKTDEIENCLQEQNPFLWPKSLWESSDFSKEIEVLYDRDKLATELRALDAMDPAKQVESISSYPVFKDGQFVAEPEVIGTQINQGKLNDTAGTAIRTFNPVINLEEAQCYIKPKYVSDSEKITTALNQMNEYLQTEVTYNVPPKTEVVNSEVISQWVTADEDLNVIFNQELVKEYVQGLADKYNTVGLERTLTTPNGKTVTIKGGDLGWKLNVEEEINALLANIQNHEVVTRDMVWSQTSGGHGDDNDYGDTYAEVDLSAQYMWFIKNGEVVLETKIVTGRPSSGHATPQGSYYLTYKQKNAVLRAPLRPDGTREYETPVAFWMPFNGGIGFHDATWQPYFGGERYIGNGSHGCVNMPYQEAGKLYDLIEKDMPVVCHY